jgi:ribose/xylose/arabinose/galactoside ABC-type transport system permease subunit
MTPQVSGSGAASAAPESTMSGSAQASTLQRLILKLKDPYFWADWTVVFALVAAILIFAALEPSNFITAYNVNTILTASAVPAILALGQAFVIMTAGIDLSNAAVLTLGAVTFGWFFAQNYPLVICMIAAILMGLLAGLINGLIIAQFKINDFIVTLGMFSLATGVALVISNAKPVQVISPVLAQFAIGKIWVIPYLMILAFALLLVCQFLLTQTRFGTHVLATGGSVDTARAMGVRTKAIKISVYAISGTLAGVAAIVTISRIGAAEPAVNTAFLLNSVAAVVLGGVSLFGGRGNMIGPFVGAILLTMIINGLIVAGVPQYYQFIAIGLIVMVSAVLVRSAK